MQRESLGDRLVDQERLDEPELARTRKERMRAMLEAERESLRKIRIACITAWALTLLLPVGWVLTRGLPFMLQSRGLSPGGQLGIYLGAAVLGFLGLVALIVAIITTVAWLFRSRTSSLAMVETRLAELEEMLARRESG